MEKIFMERLSILLVIIAVLCTLITVITEFTKEIGFGYRWKNKTWAGRKRTGQAKSRPPVLRLLK